MVMAWVCSFASTSSRFEVSPMARSTPSTPAKAGDGSPKSRARTANSRLKSEQSEVLVSAVISTYLLTHLHHVLQRAEYGALQEGHDGLAANYAQLRKLLCLDARTMEETSASGLSNDETSLAA